MLRQGFELVTWDWLLDFSRTQITRHSTGPEGHTTYLYYMHVWCQLRYRLSQSYTSHCGHALEIVVIVRLLSDAASNETEKNTLPAPCHKENLAMGSANKHRQGPRRHTALENETKRSQYVPSQDNVQGQCGDQHKCLQCSRETSSQMLQHTSPIKSTYLQRHQAAPASAIKTL